MIKPVFQGQTKRGADIFNVSSGRWSTYTVQENIHWGIPQIEIWLDTRQSEIKWKMYGPHLWQTNIYPYPSSQNHTSPRIVLPNTIYYLYHKNTLLFQMKTVPNLISYSVKSQVYKLWVMSLPPLVSLWYVFCFSAAQLCPTLWEPGQHTRLPCPSQSPEICSNPCPLSRWCHPTISSSVIPLFYCPQSFPASGSFSLFTSGGQSIGASALASVPPMHIQAWFSLGLTGLIFLTSKVNFRVNHYYFIMELPW